MTDDLVSAAVELVTLLRHDPSGRWSNQTGEAIRATVMQLARESLDVRHSLVRAGWVVAPMANEDDVRSVVDSSALPCPMCGGEGVIYDITGAIEDAQAAGTVLMPLSFSPPTADREAEPTDEPSVKQRDQRTD